MSWLFAAELEDIPPRGARVLRVGERSIALFRTADRRVFALHDRCPHRGGPLSQGIVHGSCVTCPLHDWVIDLASGAALGPDDGAVEVYAVRTDGSRIYVSVPDDRAPATSAAGTQRIATGT